MAHSPHPIWGPHIVLGIGGFFDGLVLHQLLQWHHMLTSAGWPVTSLANLQHNTTADGLFHMATYLFTIGGLIWLWRQAGDPQRRWTGRALLGGLLAGWGVFNVVEGLVDHQLLGLHHITAPY